MRGVVTDEAVECMADRAVQELVAYWGIGHSDDSVAELDFADTLHGKLALRWRDQLEEWLIQAGVKVVGDLQCCFPECQLERGPDELG